MKITRYYLVTNLQFFIMALMVGVIAGALLIINAAVKEYLERPIVTLVDGKCTAVENFKNGEAYVCTDVGTVLRNYRVKK